MVVYSIYPAVYPNSLYFIFYMIYLIISTMQKVKIIMSVFEVALEKNPLSLPFVTMSRL